MKFPRTSLATPPGLRLHSGLEVEREAVDWYLARKPAARLLARGFRCRGGELDAVIEERDGNRGLVLVLMEIRSRRTDPGWQSGLESVDPAKRRRLERAAHVFLSRYQGRARELRWDLVYFDGREFVHFPDAWRNS